jgi:shikimate dehydrogenase
LAKASYNGGVSGSIASPIDASTRFCAVFGHPVRHSASPAMQNAGLAALGLNWRYLACEVQSDHLRAAIAGARAMAFIGINLTVPHKILAVELVDALDDSARIWGAVNTIRFEARDANGNWQPLGTFSEPPREVRSHGFNTDADALMQAIREELQIELAGSRVLLLGLGGAGRTAALKLASEGVAELFLVNRTVTKAQAVAAEIAERHNKVKVTLGYPQKPVDLVLNATSLGLKPEDPLPYDAQRYSLRPPTAVYDLVYRPAETPLLKAARAAGCRAANGLGMLLFQGAKALELWTGQPAPVAVMRQALEQNVYG